VRALSFNVQHGVGSDGRLDLERAAALIEACAPDVVALQELDAHLGPRSGDVDQPTWLAERLGLAVAYGATIDLPGRRPGGPRRRYGSALLTRRPPRWWRNPPLPLPRGGEARRYVEAVLDAEDGRGATVPVRLVATHLQHDSDVGRLAQARHLAGVASASAEPVVLLGDLNAEPGARELAPLTSVLVDAWTIAGEGDRRTYPAHRPRLAIDHVLVSPTVAVDAVTVVPSTASDHRPLVADLVLPPRRPPAG
jgi:endonuclease/exonuclease/phosphatase family metal-dependent hydrolase